MPEDVTPTRITEIRLRPRITVAAGTRPEKVQRLVALAHQECYIANSLTTTIVIDATVLINLSGPGSASTEPRQRHRAPPTPAISCSRSAPNLSGPGVRIHRAETTAPSAADASHLVQPLSPKPERPGVRIHRAETTAPSGRPRQPSVQPLSPKPERRSSGRADPTVAGHAASRTYASSSAIGPSSRRPRAGSRAPRPTTGPGGTPRNSMTCRPSSGGPDRLQLLFGRERRRCARRGRPCAARARGPSARSGSCSRSAGARSAGRAAGPRRARTAAPRCRSIPSRRCGCGGAGRRAG